MRRDSLRSLGGTVVAILLYAATVGAAEANLPGPDSTAKQLVDAALASELNGPSDLRPALLKQALERDPNFAPARWQSGFVRYDNQWLTPDEVGKRVAADKPLAEYRKRRDALVDRADDHRALAQWCHKHKLADLERIHWAKVLEFNAQDAEAIAGLGLQLFEGRLLTPKQLEAARQRAIEGRQALKRWQPQMVKWRKAIAAGRGPECTAALEALDKLDDPEAIPAIEETFAENVASRKNDDLNLVLIETVGRMNAPAATEVLLRRALACESQEVRVAAADQLKKRPMFAYVPQLIAMLPEKIEVRTQFVVYVMFNNTAVHDHVISYESPSGTRTSVSESVLGSLFMRGNGPMKFRTKAQEAEQLENQARQQQQAFDRVRDEMSRRIRDVLARTNDIRFSGNPDSWQKQWDDYIESYRYELPPVPTVQTGYSFRVEYMSCFPTGTPVLTMTGTVPIEKIKVGDRVLAQDPASGELAYKMVQGVTLRPAAPLVQIQTGSTSVSATRGHPFWVNGQGWLLAKQLKVGQILHSLNGAVLIDAIDEVPAKEAYNLVVSDFDSYFVGENHLLVHDNMPLGETVARVPGFVTAVESP